MTDVAAETGAQAERTALAWQRTALALCSTSALATHVWAPQHRLGSLVVAGSLMTVVVGLGQMVRRRHRRADVLADSPARSAWPHVLASGGVCLSAALVLALL